MPNLYKALVLLFFITSANAQVIPTATISLSPSVICTDRSANISVASTPSASSYSWTVFPNKDVITSSLTESSVTLSFPKDLTYTVTVFITTATGTINVKKTIAVARSAKAAFNASLSTAGYPVQLQLTNYSSSTLKNYWKFSDVGTLDSSSSTVKNYNASGNYSVTLVSLGYKGCNDSSSYAFRISDSSSITLPNVFTPNRDEINDLFKPVTRGISQLSAWVFTREGIIIHQWNGVNGYWDGRTTSGEVCTDGVYFVVVEATGFDGKSYKLKGTITLVR